MLKGTLEKDVYLRREFVLWSIEYLLLKFLDYLHWLSSMIIELLYN